MIKNKSRKPTEGELEILTVLWKHGSASVRIVHEEINRTKDAGYTTTLKLMQIMHDKGIVTRDTGNKIHIYTPAISKEKTQTQIVNKMISNLFAGSPVDMVMQALGGNKTSPEELNRIEELIISLKAKK